MKKANLGVIVMLAAIALVANPAFAANQYATVTGRYEFENCTFKKYEGTGTLKVVSAPRNANTMAKLVVWEGTIGKVTGGTMVYDANLNAQVITFDLDGGSATVSGAVLARTAGRLIDVSSRGNFSLEMGPLCVWDAQNEQ